MNHPQIIMIAGPNGAGKSTITARLRDNGFLPSNYINPDEIVLGMTDIADPIERVYAAAREAESQRQDLLRLRESMAFETVMSHPSKIDFAVAAREVGYLVTLIFVGVASAEISVRRVSQRVADGGHDVPTQKIIDRYHRVMSLLPVAIRSVDRALLFDNSYELIGVKLIAEFNNGKQTYRSVDAPQWSIFE